VDTHVTSMFNKLGLSSRSQIGGWINGLTDQQG
jgi:hypothetical protein